MQAGRRYTFFQTVKWTRKAILVFIALDSIPAILYHFFELHWLAMPWQPLARPRPVSEFRRHGHLPVRHARWLALRLPALGFGNARRVLAGCRQAHLDRRTTGNHDARRRVFGRLFTTGSRFEPAGHFPRLRRK